MVKMTANFWDTEDFAITGTAKILLRRLATLIASLISFAILPCSAELITFDDLPYHPLYPIAVPNGYANLHWWGLDYLNVINTQTALNGYHYGMMTSPNVAFSFDNNQFPAEIDSTTGTFDFVSGYLTAAWRSNLNVEVQGFNGTNLLYDKNIVLTWNSPTLLVANFQNIDRLTFWATGGDPAFPPNVGDGTHVAFDNLTITGVVPEPSPFLLAVLSIPILFAYHWRRQHPSSS
jgi:hypothetical protein